MGKAPSSVYWVGADGNTYVKSAGVKGVQNYGKLAAGSTISGSQKIDDPNPPANSNNSTTYDASAANNPPADLSSYDQAINATNDQINNLTPSYNNLLSGANDAYQQTLNTLNQDKATADSQYGLNKTNDRQGYATDKNAIRTNTGHTINGIDSLLGERGAGGQAAGAYAGLLASRAGTGQLTAAGTTFAKNEQGLDTNYNNFLHGYDTNVKNADLTKTAAIKNAQANIDTQKANLLQSLASLVNQRTSAAGGKGTAASQPYVDQAKGLLASAASEGAPMSVAPITPTTYTAPSLLSYTTNPTTVSAGGNAATDTQGSFAPALLNGAMAGAK
jgi:hypothetical protein